MMTELSRVYLAVVTLLLISTSVQSQNVRSSKEAIRGLQEDSLPDTQPRLGEQALPGRYPYYSLSLLNDTGVCGATLISPRFVLTVAHCMNLSQVFAIGAETPDGGVKIEIANRVVHPLYNERTLENDIALFQLAEDARILSSDGELIDAPYVQLYQPDLDEDISSDTELTFIGFGHFNYLRETNLNPVSFTICIRQCQMYGGVVESNMCTKDPLGSSPSDHGSPLLLTPTDTPDGDRMVGIASWGINGYGTGIFPRVYTRTDYFYDWIVDTMCDLNDSKVPSYVEC